MKFERQPLRASRKTTAQDTCITNDLFDDKILADFCLINIYTNINNLSSALSNIEFCDQLERMRGVGSCSVQCGQLPPFRGYDTPLSFYITLHGLIE